MVNSFKPKSAFLAKYIKNFSVFEKGCDLRINFAAFPHIGPALAFLRNGKLKITESHMEIILTKEDHFNTIVLGKYTSPVFITYNGFVDEISINFTPLGINYFFDNNYSKIAPENFQNLNSRVWIDFAPKLFSTPDLEEQIDLLESFLLTQFRELNLEKLQQSVDLFMDKTNDYKVSEVAEITGINEKTMRRNFKKFVSCSPVVFKRIVRFRNTINIKSINNKLKNITRLGHENFFYDSSHFARECKLFTGRNPKSFFDNVSFLGNSSYPYIFL